MFNCMTMKLIWKLGILFLYPIISMQLSNPSMPSYVGAVIEYFPETKVKNGKSPTDLNAEHYVKFIEVASIYSADILVFPESSLSIRTLKNGTIRRADDTSYVPDPKDNIIICDDDRKIFARSLKVISCAARARGLYVVANHLERVDCAPGVGDCPPDGLLVYNTNVAFDRGGRVVARYRKHNLFGEPGTNASAEGLLASVFTTDFNVTFGQFICFDILFEAPALTLVRELGVTDLLFSTRWYSELPFLYSATTQNAWAYANDVNLLSAGHNNPWTGSSGSGIYIGRKGYVNVISEGKIKNYLIVSEIPKVINGKRSLNIDLNKAITHEFDKLERNITTESPDKFLYKKEDLNFYTTEVIDIKTSTLNQTVCNEGLCCNFQLKIKYDEDIIKHHSSYYRYRFTSFNGVRTFSGIRTGGITVCGIIACANDALDSCNKLIHNNQVIKSTTFEFINIRLHTAENRRIFYMPITLTEMMTPLNATEFSYKSINLNGMSTYTMQLTNPRRDLLTFAIFGRNFDLDGLEVMNASSCVTVIIYLWLQLIAISVHGLIYIFVNS